MRPKHLLYDINRVRVWGRLGGRGDVPVVIVFYCLASHHKRCNFKQYPHVSYLTVVQIRSLGSAHSITKLKSSSQLGLALIWRLGKESASKLIHTVGRIWFLGIAGLMVTLLVATLPGL